MLWLSFGLGFVGKEAGWLSINLIEGSGYHCRMNHELQRIFIGLFIFLVFNLSCLQFFFSSRMQEER